MYEVTVTAQRGTEKVEDVASGNTARTAYAASQALARSYEAEGYVTHIGRVTRKS